MTPGNATGRPRPRLTYANVVATLALFLSLTGATAYAVEKLPNRSVGEFQLRPGAITASKIRKNAVITPKIKAKAVTTPKLGSAAVDGRVLAAGAVSSDKILLGAVTHEKVAPEAITGDQVVESSLAKVPSAGTADFASSAESANPLAFADIDANGNLNPNLSKGLSPADVTKTAEGIYCVTVPGFIPRGAQATAKNTNTGAIVANVTIGGTGSCSFPKVEVQTYGVNTGMRSNERFYLVLYR